MKAKKLILVVIGSMIFLVVVGIVSLHEKIEYFYFDVADSEVDEINRRKPDRTFYVGDKVPMKSTVDWNDRELQVLDVDGCCVPYLEIRSPVSLSDMIVTNGDIVSKLADAASATCVPIIETEENVFLLRWIYWPEESGESTCIRIGDEISIQLVPKDGSDPYVLRAILVSPGYYLRSRL